MRIDPMFDDWLPGLAARACTAVAGIAVGAMAVATLLVPLVARADDADQRVVDAATAVLRTHLAGRTEAVRIEPRPLFAGTVPPGAETTVSARPLAADAPIETRMRVWVDLHAPAREGGRFLRSIPVPFDVAGTRTAWLAVRDVPAGMPIAQAVQDGALRETRVDIGSVRSAPALGWPDAARLRRALRAGDALVASHLEATPAVTRGDTVAVLVRGGPIGIEARAEALQDGVRGAAVWVRVAQATAPVRARVVDVSTVEVLP